MGEVKRYKLRDNMPDTAVLFLPAEVVSAEDYATLEAENAKLRAELERRESHWFSLVMNCAAELETASYCMTDTAAKRVAQSGANHYRKQANAAPSAPKADDPVKQMLLEALEYFVSRKAAILAKFDIHGPADIAAGMRIKLGQAEAAIAAARKGEGE